MSADETSTTTSKPWHNLVAGGVAGACSRMATAPLDLVRIRRQLAHRTQYPSESVWRTWQLVVENEGGIGALFRGNAAAIYLWVGYAAVQFEVYTRCCDRLRSMDYFREHHTSTAFAAGAVAGVCATLSTYPFDVCRTTFAARGLQSPKPPPPAVPFHSLMEPHFSTRMVGENKPPSTLLEFAQQLYRTKGWRGFYAGAAPALLQIIPYMGASFAIYDRLTTGDRSAVLSGYAGSISGGVSKIMVYPLDTVKRRFMAQAFYVSLHDSDYRSTLDCFRRIASEEGLMAFYRGVVPSVLKSTIASGLSFFFFRLVKNGLEAMEH